MTKPNYIAFSGIDYPGNTSYINCGSSDRIAGIISKSIEGRVTYDLWIRATELRGHIWSMADPGYQYHTSFRIAENSGDPGRIVSSFIGGKGTTVTTNKLVIDTWTHLALTYNDWDDRKLRIWFNGLEAAYDQQNVVTGTLLGDDLEEFIIGIDDPREGGPMQPFYGRLGWVRISNRVRWTSNFSPPGRCSLPAIDDNTLAQWIGTEIDPITIVDNQQGNSDADGTPYYCTWGFDCTPDVAKPGTHLYDVTLGAV